MATQADQRGDLVVVVVLAYLGPGFVGHAVVGVGGPGTLLGERQRGPLGVGNTVDSRRAATRLSRTGVSPAAAASLVYMSMHQPQPLIWLASSDTSSCVDLGSGDWWITRLALGEPLGELGGDLVVEHVESGIHDVVLTRGRAGRELVRGVLTDMEMPATWYP
jgi:hypothetical protein